MSYHAISQAIRSISNVSQFVSNIEDNVQHLCEAIKNNPQNDEEKIARAGRIACHLQSIICGIGALLVAPAIVGGLILGNVILVIGATASFIVFYDMFKMSENMLTSLGKGNSMIQTLKETFTQPKSEREVMQETLKDTILLGAIHKGIYDGVIALRRRLAHK